jgi:antitoxin VapB
MDTAKLFQNGKSQAVRLPKKYRFEGDKVLIKKMGSIVLIFPYGNPWEAWAESLKLFSSDYLETREQPEQQTREGPFT